MGYKRAGYRVMGANDIDQEMMENYTANLDSGTHIVAPIGELAKNKKLVDSWYGIDVLDGSPPCTSFSVGGQREKTWGQNRHFREGQAVQVLDQLFFDYLDLVDALQPRVFIAENVYGMWAGNAKGYVKRVVEVAHDHGYDCQVFALSAADYGVPQYRRRLFFIGRRRADGLPPLRKPEPSIDKWVSPREAFRNVPTAKHEDKPLAVTERNAWKYGGGPAYSKAVRGKDGYYSQLVINPDTPRGNTIASSGHYFHWEEPRLLRVPELLRMGTFPDDYRLVGNKNMHAMGKYIVGMSVPPFFMESIAGAVRDQWLT